MKQGVAQRAALMVACALPALGSALYSGYKLWDQHREQECHRSGSYWAAGSSECIPRHNQCYYAGRAVALGETYRDGCNWCTCGPYLLTCTSKYCVR